MKYIDANKLVTEIRKLRSGSCISESDDYYEYAKSEIIDIINSLQQEQLEVDLVKEIARFALNGGTGDNTPTIGETARHFYELGLKARKEDEK